MPPLHNHTFDECEAACTTHACQGFCFQGNDPHPLGEIGICYVKNNHSHYQDADLSYSNHCTGTTSPSDCPFNLYRTSGDIGTYWDRVLSNLATTVPFLGSEDEPPLSRPGGWAYPVRVVMNTLPLAYTHLSLAHTPPRAHTPPPRAYTPPPRTHTPP